MSEIVERVARAICRATILGSDLDGEIIFDDPNYVIPAQSRADRIPIVRWKLYVGQARAAIEATREHFSHTKSSEFDGFLDEVDAALREKVDA